MNQSEQKERNLGGVGKGIGSMKPCGKPHEGWPHGRQRKLSNQERRLLGRRDDYDRMDRDNRNPLKTFGKYGCFHKPGSNKK